MDDTANFTPRAQQVLAFARKEADRLNHNFLGTEHLLLGLAVLGQGVAVNVLHAQGVDLDNLRAEVEKQIGTGPDQKIIGNTPYTPRVKKVIALADKERRQLHHTYLGTEHLLLGLLREDGGVAAIMLKALNVDLEQTRIKILRELDPDFCQQSDEAAGRLATLADAKETLKNLSTPTQEPAKPKSDPVDARRRYDVYCVERNQETLVYRNAKINGTKRLAPSLGHDRLPDFAELEQSDGQIVLVALNSIVKICEHGVKPNAERVQE